MAEKNPTTSRMEREPMNISCHELREIETSKARELARKVLFKNNGNVSKTAHTLYEWNLMDVGTKTSLTAYSYELSPVFGLMFIVFAALWLRAHNVRGHINCHVQKFPVVLMEYLLKTAGIITMFFKSFQTGKYVYTKCQDALL